MTTLPMFESAPRVKIRADASSQKLSYGELMVDLENQKLLIGDGCTCGGLVFADLEINPDSIPAE